MPQGLLSGRPPLAAVPEGSVLLVSLVLLKTAVSPWPPGCLVPGRLGSLKAAARLWRRASGCLLLGRLAPLKVVPQWRGTPPGHLLPGRRVPLKAAAAPWRRVPPDQLVQVTAVSPWWPAPPGCLVPPDRRAGSMASVLPGAVLESPPVSPRAARR